jgi:hypothetical protein
MHYTLLMVNPAGDSETVRIVRGLIDRTLPKREWTHHAHLRAGLWHVLHHSDAAALELLRGRIQAYNEATGVANTPNSGYHETITRFYVVMIRAFLRSADSTLPLDTLAEALIERIGARDLPLRYYSAEVLFSAGARAAWVEADREPLGGEGWEDCR